MASRLCIACGFCCNGVLFRDVELQSGDDAVRLAAQGLVLEHLRRKSRLAQPCAALGSDQCCRIYADRPAHCRQFECALLQSVNSRRVSLTAALRTIESGRQKKDKVDRLLAQLGDRRPDLPLLARFRRTVRRMENRREANLDAAAFARLTGAFQQLQVFLATHFLPGPEGGSRRRDLA